MQGVDTRSTHRVVTRSMHGAVTRVFTRTPQWVSRAPGVVPMAMQVVTDVAPGVVAAAVIHNLVTGMVVAVYMDTVGGSHSTASKSVQPTGGPAVHAVGVDILPLFVVGVNTLML